MKAVSSKYCLLLCTILLAGCEQADTPVFQNGQMVRAKVGGHKGQVISSWCFVKPKGCRYDVRFSSLEVRTNTRIFSDDDPITLAPLTKVEWMRDFELEPENP
jgi:hypothetical protein